VECRYQDEKQNHFNNQNIKLVKHINYEVVQKLVVL
jgi:hypothetical protein